MTDFVDNGRLIWPATNADVIPPMVYCPNFLSSEECDNIVNFVEGNQDLEQASIGIENEEMDSAVNLDYRSVLSTGLTETAFPNLYERWRNEIVWQNNDYYHFQLTGMYEDIQYLKYETQQEQTPAGHYNWHVDIGGGYASRRKLTSIIQLSDENSYEGCDLQLFREGLLEMNEWKSKGTMITFPSFTPHQVTEITKGIRRCLVVWVGGPPLR